MKLPRDLAGRALVKILCRDWAYRVVHQEGSHIILDTEEPSHHGKKSSVESSEKRSFFWTGGAASSYSALRSTLAAPN